MRSGSPPCKIPVSVCSFTGSNLASVCERVNVHAQQNKVQVAREGTKREGEGAGVGGGAPGSNLTYISSVDASVFIQQP